MPKRMDHEDMVAAGWLQVWVPYEPKLSPGDVFRIQSRGPLSGIYRVESLVPVEDATVVKLSPVRKK